MASNVDISHLPPPPAPGEEPQQAGAVDISHLPPPPAPSDPDSPDEDNVFGDMERVQAGFGNEKGIAKHLAAKGYSDVKTNKNGDMVFKKGDRWVKDASNFFGDGSLNLIPAHPVNWAEKNVGATLPLAGGMVGGVVGHAIGAAPAFIPGMQAPAVVTSKLLGMAGAGIGGAGGEMARQAIGTAAGTYDGDAKDRASDIAAEGLTQAAADGLGSFVLAPAMGAAKPYLKAGAAKASEFLTGIPSKAWLKVAENPAEYASAGSKEYGQLTGRVAQDELEARRMREGNAITAARRKFQDQHGQTVMDTSPIIQKTGDYLDRKMPFEGQERDIPLADIDALRTSQKSALTTENPVDLSGGVIPEQKLGRLQARADQLKGQIDDWEPGLGKSSAIDSANRQEYGLLKRTLHDVSPEYGKADEQFTDYAAKAKLLKQVNNDGQVEGVMDNILNRNRGNRADALEDLAPEAFSRAEFQQANKMIGEAKGGAGSSRGHRNLLSAAGLGGAAVMHTPLGLAIGAGVVAGTRPALHEAAWKGASNFAESGFAKMLADNPSLMNGITSPELKSAAKAFIESDAFQKMKLTDQKPIEDAQQKFTEGN